MAISKPNYVNVQMGRIYINIVPYRLAALGKESYQVIQTHLIDGESGFQIVTIIMT